MIKKILKYIVVFIVTTIVFWGLLLIASSIPKKYIEKNIKKSSEILMDQTESVFVNSNGRTIYNHNSTDAIMLNIIYSIDRDNLVESVLRTRRNYIPNVSERFVEDIVGNLKYESKRFLMTKELYKLVNGEEQTVYDYARYWHGYIAILIPLLLIFDIIGIRIVLQMVLLVFLLILIYFIYKTRGLKYALLYLVAFIALDALAWIITIQGMLVMIVAVFFSMLIAMKKISSKNLNISLFLSGAITAYLDFFTTPLMAFLLPVITYKLVNVEETTLKNEVKNFIKNGITWLFGYLGLWIMKWVIIDFVLNTNVVKSSFDQIILRIGLDNGRKANENPNMFALLKNCIFSANIVNTICYVITCISGIAILFKRKLKYYLQSSKLCYYFCAIIPVAWFFIVASHSEQHYFYTYRTLLITLLGFMLIVFDDRKKLENKDVEND